MIRRSLTQAPDAIGILAQRRGAGGARHEISARLVLRSGTTEYDGWALNISRGGIRVVIEGRVHLGQVLSIEGYDPDNVDAPARRARVVWCQDEPDGTVVGMEFIDGIHDSPQETSASPCNTEHASNQNSSANSDANSSANSGDV